MNQEFAENIKNHIREYLPVDYQDAKITLEKVTKGNDLILTGLIIRKDDETAAPSIYLEHYEEQFGKGRPMDDIMKEIAQIKMENSLELPIDVKGLQDYETARPLLAIRLCDPEKNQEYLKDKPHTACGELAATYRIQIMEDSSGTASAVVTNDMLNLWGITPEQLDYINAHGTSTHHNDLFETKAIKIVLGDHAYKTKINSTKSMIGHLLGAAGGVEFITCVKSIQEGYVHATAGLEKDDPECDLDYCKGEGVQMDVNCAISNSLGFGGHNATLLVKKFEA